MTKRERIRPGEQYLTDEEYIAAIVARAPKLTAEQIERLRALLPPVDGSATP